MEPYERFEWEFLGQQWWLLPQKALFWKNEDTLIVADLHIGKVGHFRKAGIAIPQVLEQEDLAVLSDLIYELKPGRLIFLGDLFHSEHNSDWNWLELWRELFPQLEMILVKGNHDVLHEDYYHKAGFNVVSTFATDTFLFLHEPLKQDDLQQQEKYIFSGHIHPGIKLRGAGRQGLTLSCFLFGEKQAILPAFGKFTGKYCPKTSNYLHIFGIANKKIIKL